MIELIKAFYFYLSADYIKAAKEYEKINTQKALYNAANSYYRAKMYKKAIKLYSKISLKELEFKKLYNMANAYALLGEYKKAILLYKRALKIKEDADARYNLNLLLSIKKPPKLRGVISKKGLKKVKKRVDLREREVKKRMKSLKFNTLLIPLGE